MDEQADIKFLALHAKELSDEEFEPYSDEFKTVFTDDLCRNVALSGPYSAGKTSVIKRAQKKYSEKNWVLSLWQHLGPVKIKILPKAITWTRMSKPRY